MLTRTAIFVLGSILCGAAIRADVIWTGDPQVIGAADIGFVLEICDDRYNRRSTILTSQLPVEKWHVQIGDPTVADSVLDRVVHNAHRIEMRGDSMRKNRGRQN